jgi:mannose-6-phosphate isomerase-like protein (cupin superfamily)
MTMHQCRFSRNTAERILNGMTTATKHEDGHGGSITILEQGSTTSPMRFRMVMPKEVRPPAAECHPSQTEDFTVLRGTLDLGIVEGKHVLLKAGDTFHLPAGVYHLPSSGGDDAEVEFEAVLTPGLESADMFTDLYAVFREHRGFAQFTRLSIVFRRHASGIRFKPPVRAVMSVVAAIANLFGVTNSRNDKLLTEAKVK